MSLFEGLGLIEGEEVVVVRRSFGRDELGEPTEEASERTVVPNALVRPGATSDLDASRPEGVRVDYTVSFPKAYGGELRGCLVELRGAEYAVVGSPQRYTPGNTPGDWNLTAEVTRVDG